jgi:hypothetical protein
MQITELFGTASLADEMGKSRREVVRRVRQGDITPDFVFKTPDGRKYALFTPDRLEAVRLLMQEGKTSL